MVLALAKFIAKLCVKTPATAIMPLHTLVTLGNVAEIERILLELRHPRLPR
jgi:hypothetical protein